MFPLNSLVYNFNTRIERTLARHGGVILSGPLQACFCAQFYLLSKYKLKFPALFTRHMKFTN